MSAITFKAGNIAKFVDNWRKITSDINILEIITGYRIAFDTFPCQTATPFVQFSKGEEQIIATKTDKLFKKQVIEKTSHCQDEFISTVFTRPKKDGSHRLILNLKKLNEHVTYHHFKMESLHSATQLVRQGSWMAVLDLKDAYYSVPVAQQHRKFLRFVFRNSVYEFTCLPNGLSSAPRVFTKLMKPVYASLRSRGNQLVGYIDDILLLADSSEVLKKQIRETMCLLTSLGFTVHDTKSMTEPTQEVKFLGFILNSVTMQVSMIPEKANKLKVACRTLLSHQGPVPIREVASVVGLMVASFPGVYYGPLFYRSLENDKTIALKSNSWNLDGDMIISPLAREDLRWWISEIDHCSNPVISQPPTITLKTDTSLKGWGGIIEGSKSIARGRWSAEESNHHINYLEIKAIFLYLKALCGHLQAKAIKILCDNTTAVSYLQHMEGTHSLQCNEITREIILWCRERELTISISHLPGKLNIEADRASRYFHSNTEWSLDLGCFQSLTAKWGMPEVDMFASRLNHKVEKYIAWKPDPGAIAIDAFTVDWAKYQLIYCFPPFSLIGKVLQHIQMSKVMAILVVPHWETQFWYPRLLQMMQDQPITISNHSQTLTLPYSPKEVLPLYPKLKLIGCLVSSLP